MNLSTSKSQYRLAGLCGEMWRTFCSTFCSTFGLGLALCAATLIGMPHAAIAQSVPPAVKSVLADASLSGSGTYKWFGLRLYEARLWVDKRKFSAANWTSSAFALELIYARRLYGERIAVASIDEIKKLGIGTSAQHEAWLAAMKKVFPDVEEGTQLTGLFVPGQPSRFFRDGQLIGEVPDPEFGLAFFGIWLNPRTSAPKLRAALLADK